MRLLFDLVENIHCHGMVTISQELPICVLDYTIGLSKTLLNANRHLHVAFASIVDAIPQMRSLKNKFKLGLSNFGDARFQNSINPIAKI